MYWHIDTDIVSLLLMIAIYVYSLKANAKGGRDLQTRRFLECLQVGIIVTFIDIAASVVMEVPVDRFVYHFLMTLYFAGVELTIVMWLRYCITLLYLDNDRRRRRAMILLDASYVVYALFAVTNPWTGAIYTLGANNEYHRGPLFFLMVGVYAAYALVLLALILARRKHLPESYPAVVLLLTPVIVAFSIAAQLTNPGWLMILPGYLLSLTLAFLFLQSRRAKERAAAEQMGEIMSNVSGGICASVLDENGTIHTVMANENFYDMFGYTKEQFEAELGDPLNVIVSQDREQARETTGRVVVERGKADYEFRCRRRDGSVRTVRCQNSITSIPGLGDTVLLAVMTDITEIKAAEEAARVHEAEMRLAMSQLGKMICEYDVKTRTLIVPEAYAKRYGISAVLSGVPDANADGTGIQPEFYGSYRDMYSAIHRGDATGAASCRKRWADGSLHWEQAYFYTIFDSMGKPVKAIIAVEDTSEQHRAYELEQSRPSLGEKNLLIHALFNLNTGEVLDYTYHDGQAVAPEERLSLYSRNDHLDEIVINSEERAMFREINDPAKLLKRFENGETELSFEYRRRISKDDVVWVRNILRVVREPGGSDVLLFEYCYNIETEKTHELMYNALVNENFDFVGRINGRNKHFTILTSSGASGSMPPTEGDDLDEMVRTVAVPYTYADDRDAIIKNVNVQNIKKQLENNDHFQFTSRLILKDGSIHYKALNMFYLDRERQIIIMTREDVSAAVEDEINKNAALTEALDKAEAANRAKTRFLSRMSHELRTPMNVILGTTALAQDDAQTPVHMRESCDTITSSARYLLALINDILEISRIEGGRLTVNNAPFALRQLLADVNTIIEPQARQGELSYSVYIKEGTAAEYVGDKAKLQQILINLLDNAVKFTPAGGRVRLDISQAEAKDGKSVLRFVVTDSGVGIDKAFMPHLFELFTQESSDNTTTVSGTGLGLPIAKNYAELMNGAIRVSSEKNKGSVFIVELPLEAVTSREQSPAAVPFQKPDLSGRRILIVEDNAMNAMILELLLKKAGADTEIAKNGQIAVEAFRDEQVGAFDAILMDIRMPVMDGLTATKSIRETERADSKLVPIIAVSANAFDEDVELSLQSGMNAHLAKPVEPPVLFATLNRYMR